MGHLEGEPTVTGENVEYPHNDGTVPFGSLLQRSSPQTVVEDEFARRGEAGAFAGLDPEMIKVGEGIAVAEVVDLTRTSRFGSFLPSLAVKIVAEAVSVLQGKKNG